MTPGALGKVKSHPEISTCTHAGLELVLVHLNPLMNKIRHNRLKPILILSIALLLRAVIPTGYMPASGDSGLLFEFCPEGIPAAVMQSLAGDSGHQHGHADHGDSSHDDHQCPVGHMLLSAAAVDDTWQADAVPFLPTLYTAHRYSFSTTFLTNYYSRGPPA